MAAWSRCCAACWEKSIELILLASPALGRVKADPSQIEQVIVNLATNSRDAMPRGGKLVIETANVDLEDGPASKNLGVKPGSYVMLAVSDTGVGMDPETRSRLFEPFFTTKAPGKGSGLGLATVYGAIKQSDGQVTVYSQPGCGTIFEIYLPRVEEAVTRPARKTSAKGSETILLVDDEEGVRKLVTAVLQSNGYDVLEATNGADALAAYEKNAHKIDMVLTDVVMPQMTGFELGSQLAGRAPEPEDPLHVRLSRQPPPWPEAEPNSLSCTSPLRRRPAGQGAGSAGRGRAGVIKAPTPGHASA